MLKADIIWPSSYRYKSHSDWEPVGFFSDCLCNSTSFDLMLGFFSSSAINVLSDGFAVFLHNGGRMRLIINDILSNEDRNAIKNSFEVDGDECFDLDDLETLIDILSKRNTHFFECLSWLIHNGRIDIKIIAPANGEGISHTKCGTFSDGINKVCFEGSVNFSYAALVHNIESLTVACNWNGDTDIARIRDTQDTFDEVFNEEDGTVKIINVDDVKNKITSKFKKKELLELLEDELELLNEQDLSTIPVTVANALNKVKNKVTLAIEKNKIIQKEKKAIPHFPYSTGPRPYQIEAFEKWKSNKQKGLFAMATGTGKTLTALNCLLNIYNKFKFYKAIILVPTLTLVEQWEEECLKFGFNNTTKVSSKNKNWKSEIDSIKYKEDIRISNEEPSYIIIATYASFARESIFKELTQFSDKATKQILLIADEAHNMGSGRILDRLDGIRFLRKIGLSATPERQFDEGTNKKLFNFFGSENNYTYEFSMREAIDNGFLCKYYYYPHLVKLTYTEMQEYIDISVKLAKFFNYEDNSFPHADEIVKALLLKRKRIIHKAENKKDIFQKIVEERFKQKGHLKYTIVYVPEGKKPDDECSDIFDKEEAVYIDTELEYLIDVYSKIVLEISPKTTVKKFTSSLKERELILSEFASGRIEVLTSMKCLDEGVDIPRSELAIFCSSTGNPRQFIQRRGRILRNHPDKPYAVIHDLVVIPEVGIENGSYEMERKQLANELRRVKDFAILSENADYAYEELDEILKYYNLSLF